MSAVSHSRHVCCVTRLTCLPSHTADVSAVSQQRVSRSRHVYRVTQQTCLLWPTAHMFAVPHGSHVCCVKLGEGEFDCEEAGRALDKATNEKAPHIHIYIVYNQEADFEP